MKKKRIGIICTCLIAIILTFCVIRIMETFFKIILSSGTVLCNEEERDFISKKTNIDERFFIITYSEGKIDNKIAKVILNEKNIFPSMLGDEMIIEETESKKNGEICEYIRKNDNSYYAIFICTLPYIIIIIITAGIFNKVIIPMINYNS